MAYKKGDDRYQKVLFPDCIEEYVESDAPVRLFDAFVDSLDMNELGFIFSYRMLFCYSGAKVRIKIETSKDLRENLACLIGWVGDLTLKGYRYPQVFR